MVILQMANTSGSVYHFRSHFGLTFGFTSKERFLSSEINFRNLGHEIILDDFLLFNNLVVGGDLNRSLFEEALLVGTQTAGTAAVCLQERVSAERLPSDDSGI